MTKTGIIVLSYLLIVNIIAFALYGIDKKLAERSERRKKRRIPSFVLLWMARIGGGLGCWIGMYFFHHKKHHSNFKRIVPIWIIVWMLAIAILVIFGSGDLMDEIKEMFNSWRYSRNSVS